MSEAKHTPGPWKFLAEVGRVEGGVTGESVVAFIAGASLRKLGDYPFQEMCANGKLIAAAPEMLQALEAILESASDGRGFPEWLGERLDLEVIPAIRKAKGK